MRNRALALVVILLFGGGASAGPLDPPGAPAPTLKTLDQVNPGTPLSEVAGDADAAHVITAPGRYFLDADIESLGPGMHAIQVETDDAVEIDFNGFAIRGDMTETLEAIDLGSGVALVHGGVIENWGATAITETDSSLTLRNMTLRGIGGPALMTLNRRTLIEHCLFETNSGPIDLDGGGPTQLGIMIRACVFSGMPRAISAQQADGVQILDCTFSGIGAASTMTRVVVGADALISRCTFVSGGETAVSATDRLRISDCVMRGLGGATATSGIVAAFSASVTGCIVTGYAGAGVVVGDRSIVRDCIISENDGIGIDAGASAIITGNSLELNGGGIDATFGSRVVGNTLRANGTSGILVEADTFVGENTLDGDTVVVSSSDNVIDGNIFTDAPSGIELNSPGNVVRRNTFGGATIFGTSGFTGNLVFTIRTSADYQSSGPFDNMSF
jgi:parallel beta-helix repeat protein